MNKVLLRTLSFVVTCLLLTSMQVHAQNSTTVSFPGNPNGTNEFLIEFDGVSNGGKTWTYTVTALNGNQNGLSHWLLAFDCFNDVESSDPSSSLGFSGATAHTGIKWEVSNFNSGTFSFTMDAAYDPAPITVVAKAGPNHGTSTITGPSCSANECINLDPPSWPGTFFSNGDGTGYFKIQAPGGLASLELKDFTNVEFLGIEDGSGSALSNYTVTSTLIEWDGSGSAYTAQAEVTVGAQTQGTSRFFVHITDLCDKTLRIDPALDLGKEAPYAYSLEQNYPNPFNPQTRIRFEVPRASQVTLAVYDVLGRRIKTLVEGHLEAGSHEAIWDGTNATGSRMSSGTYFYRLEAGNHVEVRQMLLMK